jgi:hypothetical protein
MILLRLQICIVSLSQYALLQCVSSNDSLTSSNLLCQYRSVPYCRVSLFQCFCRQISVSLSQYALLHCVSHPMPLLCLCMSSMPLMQCFSYVFTFTYVQYCVSDAVCFPVVCLSRIANLMSSQLLCLSCTLFHLNVLCLSYSVQNTVCLSFCIHV